MAILNILHFPDDRLRTIAKPIETVTDKHRTLINNMLETMYDAPGIGLAATQVNVHERILVIDISEEKKAAVFINSMMEMMNTFSGSEGEKTPEKIAATAQ